MHTGERPTGNAHAERCAPVVEVGSVNDAWSTPNAVPLQEPHWTVTEARLVSAEPSVFVLGFVQRTSTFAACAVPQATSNAMRSVLARVGVRTLDIGT
jgi:hypothetical protein